MKNIHWEQDDLATPAFLNEWENNSDFIIAHTSGSTGIPQKIKLLKRDMVQSAMATCKFFNINRESMLVCPLSADYIAGKMMIVRAIVSGATLYMIKPQNSFVLPKSQKIDLIPIVPSQLPGLLKVANNTIIMNVIIGGAPLSQTQELSLKDCSFTPYATYGMTETCSHVALRKINGTNRIYEALPGYFLTTDNRNCLVIENTNTSFKKIITNDVVQLNSAKTFIWLGRYDNVINTGGLKVHPETIENHISHLMENRNFYITGITDSKWGETVALVIEGEYFNTDELNTALKEVLSRHEMPRKYFFIKEMPRTDSGKIKRIKPVN